MVPMNVRRETLSEYAPKKLALTVEQRDALLALLPGVSIRPELGTEDVYEVTPSSYVGALTLGDNLEIVVRPKFSTAEVMFLVSYAIDPRAWSDPFSRWRDELAGLQQDDELVEAIVPSFLKHVASALARGVLQGYRVEEDALATVRGRVMFEEQLRRRPGQPLPIDVRFDEFTEDIELNRVLRAATARLARMRLRRTEHREGLRAIDTALERVELVAYGRPPVLPPYSRLSEHYRGAVELALLIIAGAAFDVHVGEVPAHAFVIDMNKVFERFALVALREALGVEERTFPAGARGRFLALDDARPARIDLEPDLSWWERDGSVSFVGDLKYKRTLIDEVKHPDAYQLLAYAVGADTPSALLIYAAGEAEAGSHSVVHAGKRLEITTLDVQGEPHEVLARVEAVAERIHMQRAETLWRRRASRVA